MVLNQSNVLKISLAGDADIKLLSEGEILCSYAKQALGMTMCIPTTAIVDACEHRDTISLYAAMYRSISAEFTGQRETIRLAFKGDNRS